MENVFEELVGTNVEQDQQETATESTPVADELGEDYTLDVDDLLAEEDEATSKNEETPEIDVVEEDDNVTNPTNSAFAQMRVQNKQYANKLNELDAIAKAAGLKDVDELIAKSKEASIKRQAKEQGIPEAVAQELAEMREFREEVRQKEVEQAQKAKEQSLVNNLQSFISDNNLSKEAVQKLSDNLENDGFSLEYLMDLPKGALNRILGSYAGSTLQKNLERKDAIKNELPLNQSSKIDNNALLKEIDDLARQFAGK